MQAGPVTTSILVLPCLPTSQTVLSGLALNVYFFYLIIFMFSLLEVQKQAAVDVDLGLGLQSHIKYLLNDLYMPIACDGYQSPFRPGASHDRMSFVFLFVLVLF